MLRTPAPLPLQVYCGTASGLTIICQNGEGEATDLTGWTAHAQVRRKRGSTASIATITTALTDAANGEITLSLTEAQTAALTPDKYSWDLLLESPAGEVTGPYIEGGFHVLAPYTVLP